MRNKHNFKIILIIKKLIELTKKLIHQLIHHVRNLVPANYFFSPVIPDGFRGQLLLVAPCRFKE